jgi:hypothetical protein
MDGTGIRENSEFHSLFDFSFAVGLQPRDCQIFPDGERLRHC